MRRCISWIALGCCLFTAAAAAVSCKAGGYVDEETLRADFERYVSYDGSLPFDYIFSSFAVDGQELDGKTGLCAVGITAEIEAKYSGEIYSVILYDATVNYSKIDGDWAMQYVVVEGSEIKTGFDMGSLFAGTVWYLNEELSGGAAADPGRPAPLSLRFRSNWQDESVMTSFFNGQQNVEYAAAYLRMEAYSMRYSAGLDSWDFKIAFQDESGAGVDFIHRTGPLYDIGSWAVGYRFSIVDAKSAAIYMPAPSGAELDGETQDGAE
jgi:hypothetical protein